MARREEGFLQAKDGLKLFWRGEVPDAPKAHLAVLPGYGEHSGRYRDFLDAMAADGYAAYSVDFRGHGKSEGRRGHCRWFAEYLDDLEIFLRHLRPRVAGGRLFVLGHSHGGLIAIHYLAKRRPDDWVGLVLSAPYLKLAFRPPRLKIYAAKVVGNLLPWLPFKSEIGSEKLTRDPVARQAVDEDPLYNRVATPGWFLESNRAQSEVESIAPSLAVPTLLLCGAADPIASTAASRRFFELLGARDKNYIEYPEMLHEPLNELGKERVWRDISHWISNHS